MKKLKIKKSIIFVLFISLFCLVVGISFTILNFNKYGDLNRINSGKISMVYTEPSTEVRLDNALPKNDEDGMIQSEFFEFNVSTNALTNENDDLGISLPYEISLSEKDIDSDKLLLNKENIKIYLTKVIDNTEVKVFDPVLISSLESSSFIDDAIKIYNTTDIFKNGSSNISTTYRLRIWIDYNTNMDNYDISNQYQYKFVVNINSKASLNENNDTDDNNTKLSSIIKKTFTIDNKMANESNDFYYLTGNYNDSDNDSFSNLLGQFGYIYLYRTSIGDDGDIFDEELIEEDFKTYYLNEDMIDLDTYNEHVSIFGGIFNYIKAYSLGMVRYGEYASTCGDSKDLLCTKDDILSLSEIVSDSELFSKFFDYLDIEFFFDIISDDTIIKLYYNENTDTWNEDLLNKNLLFISSIISEETYNESFLPAINAFGSMLNFVIAEYTQSYTYDEDNNTYIIGELSTLSDLLLSSGEEKVTVADNSFVSLDNILWQIVGVNSDNSIVLLANYSMYYNGYGENNDYLNNKVAKYLGYNNYENSSVFLNLINNSTLKDLILKRNYNYLYNNQEFIINSYASLFDYKYMDLNNSNFKYLNKNKDNYDKSPEFEDFFVSDASLYIYNWYGSDTSYYFEYKYYDFKDNDINYNSYSYIRPMITISDIDVIGNGSISNPFRLENEVFTDDTTIGKNIAKSSLLFENLPYLSSTYGNYDRDKSSYNYFYDGFKSIYYQTGINYDNKCYFANVDGEENIIDTSKSCESYDIDVIQLPSDAISYVNNPVTFSVSGSEYVDRYQWQQLIDDNWIDIIDITNRISGSKTSTLTITPSSDMDEITKYRCILSSSISLNKVASTYATLTTVLSDGEFVYEEIDDSNKYQIISYIGDYTDSSYFTLNNDNSLYSLDIPSSINGDNIINVESLYEENLLSDSTFDDSVYNIYSITINEGIKKINNNTFENTLISSLSLPNGLEEINGSFKNAKLNSISLPNSLKVIGNSSFFNSTFDNLILPNDLEIIGDSSFYNSTAISLIIPNKVTSIGAASFYNTKLTTLDIPSSVKTIGAYAFSSSELTSLTLHEGLERIESYRRSEKDYYSGGAFYNAKLTSISLPNSLKYIGDGTFFNSTFDELEFGDGLEYIGAMAFYNSSLTTLDIPGNVKVIGGGAFFKSELTSLTLHEGLENIEEAVIQLKYNPLIYGAFNNALLTELVLPSTLKEIGANAFYNSVLSSLTLGDNVETIAMSAFYKANLTSLVIPSSVRLISDKAFYSSKFTSLTIKGKSSLHDFEYLGSYIWGWANGYSDDDIVFE